MKKKALIYISSFFVKGINFFIFLLEVIYKGNFFSKLDKATKTTAVILANGPSLKKELSKLNSADEFKSVDFFVLNYFANQDIFFQIKPKHYSFVDPMFFVETHRIGEVQKLFSVLEQKVNWNLSVYVPASRYKSFISHSKITNKHINIIKVNNTIYQGFDRYRNYFYKLGLAMPEPGTVANLAIFVALNKKYKKIKLYGVDHTFFDSLYVNKNNQLCNRQLHFYRENSVELKPILRIDNGETYKISGYLESVRIMFQSHDYLNEYSNYLAIEILNCTKNSMIDSYDRK
jgi:hypothetical protein